MKALGIVRKVDELGRFCLPKELRRGLDLKEGDGLEIYVDADTIILKKYEPACIFCQSMDGVTVFKGKLVCNACRDDMAA